MKRSLKEDSSVPTGGSYDSPSALLCLHTISSLFPLIVCQGPFSCVHIFSISHYYSPSVSSYKFHSAFTPASICRMGKLSSSLCSSFSAHYLPLLVLCLRSLLLPSRSPAQLPLPRACVVIWCVYHRLSVLGTGSCSDADFHSSFLIRE